jgi:hypothetical protein
MSAPMPKAFGQRLLTTGAVVAMTPPRRRLHWPIPLVIMVGSVLIWAGVAWLNLR